MDNIVIYLPGFPEFDRQSVHSLIGVSRWIPRTSPPRTVSVYRSLLTEFTLQAWSSRSTASGYFFPPLLSPSPPHLFSDPPILLSFFLPSLVSYNHSRS